jgi:single-strand DNA-binding protein
MKVITIAGNIGGKDAVTRRTQNGDAVTGFSVGVTERGKEKRTFWFDVSIWGKRGETLAQYLTKGSKVVVTGELTTREHEGKTYLGVTANDITLMGGGQKDDGGKYPGPNDNVPMPHGLGGIDDEIPF